MPILALPALSRPRPVAKRAALAAAAWALLLLHPVPLAAQTPTDGSPPDSILGALDFLIGRWRVPDDSEALVQRPELAELVIRDVRWMVGGKAIRYREHVALADDDDAQLEGMIYWDPARERIGYVAVAGRGAGQGRLFVGRITPIDGGRVETVYDVYYRTLADTPGDALGGSSRRFREVIEPNGPDGLAHTLEWWHEGRWQPWQRGRYELVRVDGGE